MKKVISALLIFSVLSWNLTITQAQDNCTIKESKWYDSIYEYEGYYEGLPQKDSTKEPMPHLFYAKDNDKYFLVHNGIEWKKYDHIDTLKFLKDEKNILYLAKENDKYFLVHNGKEWKKYDAIYALRFSKDEKNILYLAKQNGKYFLVENWVEKALEDHSVDSIFDAYITDDKKVMYNGVIYSQDSDYHDDLFVVFNGKRWRGYWSIEDDYIINDGNNHIFAGMYWLPMYDIVYNGEIVWSHSIVYGMYLLPNGWYIYEATDYDGYGYTNYININGNKKEYYSLDTEYWLTVVKDKIYYTASESENKAYVVVDNVPQKSYDEIYWWLQFNIQWTEYSYIAVENDKKFVVRNAIEWKKYDNIYYLTYSPDGKNIYYVAQSWNKEYVVVNNKEIASHIATFNPEYWDYNLTVSDINISHDGSSLSYVIDKWDKKVIVKDWIESKPYDNIFYIYYSDKWNDITYQATQWNKQFVVKNWVEWKKYDFVSLYLDYLGKPYNELDKNLYDGHLYTFNEQDFVYVAKDNGKEFIVRNGVEWKKYDLIYWSSMKFKNDWKTLVYRAKIDDKMVMVEYSCDNSSNQMLNNSSQTKPVQWDENVLTKAQTFKKMLISRTQFKNQTSDTLFQSLDKKLLLIKTKVSQLDKNKKDKILINIDNAFAKKINSTNNELQKSMYIYIKNYFEFHFYGDIHGMK